LSKTKRRRRPGRGERIHARAGRPEQHTQLVWFTCSSCRCRIAVGPIASGEDSLATAELALAVYGEPPVCKRCKRGPR
jgi:hypothetical protein